MTRRYYSDSDLTHIGNEYATLDVRRLKVQERYLMHRFEDNKAKELATHGLGRRVGTLVRCIENTFELLPPRSNALPTSNNTHDALIQIQTFIMNVFGCLDNLAWVWVLERKVLDDKGNELDRNSIGLRAKNQHVRASLPDHLREYLECSEEWFAYLVDYRDALAHRIPLYVPPYAVDPENISKHHELDEAITKSIVDGKPTETARLRDEQDALKFFRPFILHSFSESKPTALHLQMLSDFKTIEAISEKMLDALAQSEPQAT